MLIIFDLDHTLYNSDKFLRARTLRTRAEMAAHLGVTEDEAREIFKRKKQELLDKHEIDNITATKILESMGIPRKRFLEILESIHPKDYVEFDQKAYDTILKLSKDHELVVLSNSPVSQVKKTLDVLRISHFFTRVYGADDFHDSKPNPAVFKKIVEDFNYPVSKVVSVGDDIYKEMMPSKQLGLTTVLRTNDIMSSEYADYIIAEIDEIIEVVERIEKDQ